MHRHSELDPESRADTAVRHSLRPTPSFPAEAGIQPIIPSILYIYVKHSPLWIADQVRNDGLSSMHIHTHPCQSPALWIPASAGNDGRHPSYWLLGRI